MAVMLMFVSLSGVYASNEVSIYDNINNESILDTQYTENVYKFSENSDIMLPFIRVSTDRMIIDKDIFKSGFSYSGKNMSVLNNLKGIQILTSSDTVRVTGNMEYGMIIAPTVIIDGTIDKSLAILSENIVISENAVIKEDLLCSTTNLDLYGNIEGNLLGLIGKANISGNISQDFRANVGSITLGENSNIRGNIYLTTYNNIDISNKYPNATINIIKQQNPINRMDIWKILRTSLIFALIYLLISNKTNIIKNMLSKIKTYKWTTILSGFISILIFPLIAIIIFMLTLIGIGVVTIPVAILYVSFMILSFMLSTLIVGSVMSEYIINKYTDKIKGNLYKCISAFCIFLLLNLIISLPTIGYTLMVALCILSVGIIFTSIFRKIKE
jgi:hypothetical protein